MGTEPLARNVAIDRFRGGLIVLMVGGNFLAGIAAVPGLIKHSPDLGITIADLVAPCFVFAIGLTYRASFLRRFAVSPVGAYQHFLLRYLALIGVGAIISAGGAVVGQQTEWGVLQAIGVAGLICLIVIRLPGWARFLIGAALLAGYQVAVELWALPLVLGSEHGGFVGAVAWGALLILATAVADTWQYGRAAPAICCAIIAAAGAASTVLVPLSKPRVSLSFVLVALAVAATAYLIVDLVSRLGTGSPGVVSWWGENPLALYLLHLLLLGLVQLPPVPGLYIDAPPWLAAVELAAILAALTLAAWWLHRRRLRLAF
jgi:predicted acyltransferase